MNQDQLDAINLMQEVLRGVIAAVTAQPGIDNAKLGLTLTLLANDERFSPMARRMLADLAEWPETLARAEMASH